MSPSDQSQWEEPTHMGFFKVRSQTQTLENQNSFISHPFGALTASTVSTNESFNAATVFHNLGRAVQALAVCNSERLLI